MVRNRYIIIVVLLIACLFYTCTETQDEHYKRSDSLPSQTLYELIAGSSDLSVFSRLIEIADYDNLLSSSQTFTVWAPNNSALSDIDVNSITKAEARLIVENHIARFNHSTSKNPLLEIKMRNKKVYFFSEGGNSFGGASLQKRDVLAQNGILHTLQSQISYFPNIYEYITTSPHTSKMAEFISQFEEYVIDRESIEADGTIRDTVYVRYNYLFDWGMTGTYQWFGSYTSRSLGTIDREDSLYTAIIPDNAAWDAAYARISPYFRAARNDESTQRFQTSLAIVENLFFRGKIEDPAEKDSLVSTSPSIIRQPASLFEGTQKIQASNGLVYLTENTVNYTAQETFMKPIYVEADEPEGRRINNNNTTILPRVLDGASNDLATDSRFLEVYQTSLDDNMENQPRVTFDIPQVLAGRYNLYAEFLPGEFVRQGDPRATKFRCTLYYQNATGNTVSSVVNNVVTNTTEKVKVLLFSGFNFPVANYYDRIWMVDYGRGMHGIDERVISTMLEIAVRVTAAEYNSRQFGRSYCIDRIILEPVQN